MPPGSRPSGGTRSSGPVRTSPVSEGESKVTASRAPRARAEWPSVWSERCRRRRDGVVARGDQRRIRRARVQLPYLAVRTVVDGRLQRGVLLVKLYEVDLVVNLLQRLGAYEEADLLRLGVLGGERPSLRTGYFSSLLILSAERR